MGAGGREPRGVAVVYAVRPVPEHERVTDVIAKALVVGDGDVNVAVLVEVGGDAPGRGVGA